MQMTMPQIRLMSASVAKLKAYERSSTVTDMYYAAQGAEKAVQKHLAGLLPKKELGPEELVKAMGKK